MTCSKEKCPGCGAVFPCIEGPTHGYMISSSGCWHHYAHILAREYNEPVLMPTHRLSVDTYAVQHPGDGSRKAIQSVGLHLARLMLQLDRPRLPTETNDVMLGLGRQKSTLPRLSPPSSYSVTVQNIQLTGTAQEHMSALREWADATWSAWSEHHDFIRTWVSTVLPE